MSQGHVRSNFGVYLLSFTSVLLYGIQTTVSPICCMIIKSKPPPGLCPAPAGGLTAPLRPPAVRKIRVADFPY